VARALLLSVMVDNNHSSRVNVNHASKVGIVSPF
jgi:hypothetical protein